jgi:hypothetical protein
MATEVVTQLPIHRLDVETYSNMVESGALDDLPVELIEGLIVDMMSPQGVRHAEAIEALTEHFAHSVACACSVAFPGAARFDAGARSRRRLGACRR